LEIEIFIGSISSEFKSFYDLNKGLHTLLYLLTVISNGTLYMTPFAPIGCSSEDSIGRETVPSLGVDVLAMFSSVEDSCTSQGGFRFAEEGMHRNLLHI